MRIWISKYALTSGITEHDCEITAGYAYPGTPYVRGFKLGRDAHFSRNEALWVAEAARVKKLASSRKLVARLEAMRFEASK